MATEKERVYVLFREAPEWIQQVLRDLSREGYIYIGRTGVGLSHAFRKGPEKTRTLLSSIPLVLDDGPLTECMKQGTLKAIESTAQYHDLAYKLLLEQIAILGPRYVAYEDIQKLMEKEPILRSLREQP